MLKTNKTLKGTQSMLHTTSVRNDDEDMSLPRLLPMSQNSGKFPSILLNGVFNDHMVHNFHNFYRELRETGHQRAIIYIDSPGGEVHALNAICNIMDTSAIEWHTVALGQCCSCGLLLLANGDVRYVSDRSVLLFHDISFGTFGKISEITETLVLMKKTSSIVLSMFADRTKKPLSWWLEQTRKTESRDFWFGKNEALKYGIADYCGIPSWGIQPPASGIILLDKRAGGVVNPADRTGYTDTEEIEADSEVPTTRRRISKKGAKQSKSPKALIKKKKPVKKISPKTSNA